MLLARLFLTLAILVVPALVLADPSYFIITKPSKGDKWVNGQTNYVTWTEGLQQGIYTFDVELVRMNVDSLTLVALNVPSSASSLPIMLQDVPPGDDYFVAFINSTHGLMQSLSSRFTVLPADQSSNNTSQSPNGKQPLPTVTVSGTPNPTTNFAYTFPPTSGSRKAWSACGAGAAVVGVVVSLWTVW